MHENIKILFEEKKALRKDKAVYYIEIYVYTNNPKQNASFLCAKGTHPTIKPYFIKYIPTHPYRSNTTYYNLTHPGCT